VAVIRFTIHFLTLAVEKLTPAYRLPQTEHSLSILVTISHYFPEPGEKSRNLGGGRSDGPLDPAGYLPESSIICDDVHTATSATAA
jgi:hypothetical protein